MESAPACPGILLLAFVPMGFIMAAYLLDPGAWDRIRKGRINRLPSRAPGDKNIKKPKGRSRK